MTTHTHPILNVPTRNKSPIAAALRKTAFRITPILLVGFIIFSIKNSVSKEYENRNRCARNLHNIHFMIESYLADYKAFPDSFMTMANASFPPADLFICPSSSDIPANPQNYADLEKPSHCSYIYVAAGQPLSWKDNPKNILAYENPKNHRNKGAHVLYANGAVVWQDETQMNGILNQLNIPPPQSGAGDLAAVKPRMRK